MSKGNPGLVAALTVAATLGGLLFGYDTAVISGVTDAITHNFVLPRHLAESGRELPLRTRNLHGAARLRDRRGHRRSHLDQDRPQGRAHHRRRAVLPLVARRGLPGVLLEHLRRHRLSRPAGLPRLPPARAAWPSAWPRCSRPCTSRKWRRPPRAACWSPSSRSRSSSASRWSTSSTGRFSRATAATT